MSDMDTTLSDFDFKEVFDVDDYLYFYGEFLTEERTQAEVDAVVELLELETPAKILDLACGFGRHSNRLATLGHQVTGLDLTPGFLEIARRDAEDCGVQVDYQQGDMRYIEYSEIFDYVLLMFTSFGYYQDEDNQRVLENVVRALKPGGVLLLDIPNRDVFLKDMLPYIVTEKENNLMIDRLSFDTLSGRWYNRRVVIRDGVRKDKPFYVRIYNPSEIQPLLSQAGLDVIKMLGGFDGQPLSTETRRMVIVAKKAVN
jgi:SAM-dependent methyltransferase